MEPTRKPIDKEYLTSSFQDFDFAVLEKKYLQSNNVQLHTHANKEALDKLGLSNDGTLLFNGNEIGSSTSTTAGKSAYEIAQDNGFQGTQSEWLESLKGRDGTDGTDGTDGENGTDGKDGKSAYEIAVQNGFKGTEPEWLDSLKSDQIAAYTKEETDRKFVTASRIWTGSNQFTFGVDPDGNYGYIKAGADTVTPFKQSGATGALTVVVSGAANKNSGLDYASPGTPNNSFTGSGTVTIWMGDTVIGTVQFTMSTSAKLSDNHAGSYIRTSASGSGTVELGG